MQDGASAAPSVAGVDRLLPWLRRSGWAYVLAALVLALVAWRVGPGAGDGGGQPQGAAAAGTVEVSRTAPQGGPTGMVHVAGEVKEPGVYPIAAGARVIEAIRGAGGPTRKANMAGLNLAATLQDGQQVVVPARVAPGAAAGGGAAGAGAAAAGPISLSSASADDLDALDGIGPTLAARIVEWRAAHGGFASVEQLLEVPGIGPTRLAGLRSHVVP